MGQRLKFVFGSLVGAVAIHAALIACGSAGGAGLLGGDGGAAGGGSAFDALVDALSGNDAHAGGSSSGGSSGGSSGSGSGGTSSGSCSCGGPTTRASEDLGQWVSGAAPQTSTITALTTGPLIVRHLNDPQPLGEGTEPDPCFFVALNGDCSSAPTQGKVAAGLGLPNDVPIVSNPGTFAVNFPVPAGAALCWDPGGVLTNNAASWAGFKPY